MNQKPYKIFRFIGSTLGYMICYKIPIPSFLKIFSSKIFQVLTAARAWQTIVTLVERHDLFSKHLVFAFFNVNALFNKEMFSEIIALPIGHLVFLNF